MQQKYSIPTVLLGIFLFYHFPDIHAQDADLAKQLANPVANLISVPIQNNIDMGIGEFGGSKLTTNLQPVISQYSVTKSGGNQPGLGDIVLSGFLSPTSSNVSWGAGPVFLLPAGTND